MDQLQLIPSNQFRLLIDLVVDLFAKASDGRSSGDSPCAKSLSVSDSDTDLADAETESEPLSDAVAPTLQDPSVSTADDSPNIITDNCTDTSNTPTLESTEPSILPEELAVSVTPGPNVVSKAPTKRARASRAKSTTAPVTAPATKRQKAMASSAKVSVTVPVECSSGSEEAQQDSEVVIMEIVSGSNSEQTAETSVTAAITEESPTETSTEEMKVVVPEVEMKKRKRVASVPLKASKKEEEIVLSAEVVVKIQCITERLASMVGDLVSLER